MIMDARVVSRWRAATVAIIGGDDPPAAPDESGRRRPVR